MNVKKAIKRVVALGTGAALMGATVLGAAAAADLADFPEPFVKDGQFDAMIIIGQSAKPADVIGAVDIATTLQYEMKQQTTVSDSSVTSVTLEGDSFAVEKNKDLLGLYEYVGEVDDKLEATDLDALSAGKFMSKDFTQYLSFPTTEGLRVRYMENEDDEVDRFLYIANDEEIFTYEFEMDSTLSDSSADLEDEKLTILGRDYTISSVETASDNEIKMTLLGGETSYTMLQGETETITMPDGTEYEVEAFWVGTTEAILKVDGYQMDKTAEGSSDKIDGLDLTVGIKEVLPMGDNEPDMVSFYLGADEVILEDTDVTSDSAGGKKLDVGEETYNNVVVQIQGTSDSSEGTLTFDGFTLKFTADDDYFVGAGEALSDYIDGSKEDYLFGGLDVTYEGPAEPSTNEVAIDANNEQFYVEFTTVGGAEYKLPYAYTIGADVATIGEYGSTTSVPLFTNYTGTATADKLLVGDQFLSEDDLFMVADGASNEEEVRARFLEVTDVDWEADDVETTIEFRDLASGGADYTVILKNESTTNNNITTNTLTIDGEDHVIYQNISSGGDTASFWIDQWAGTREEVVGLADGNSWLTFDTDNASGVVSLTLTLAEDVLDSDETGDVTYQINLTGKDADDVKLGTDFKDVVGADGYITQSNEDHRKAYGKNGVEFLIDDDAEDVTVTIPTSTAYEQAFVVAGDVTSQTVSAGADGSAYTISPVGTDVAVLDTEASGWSNENIIVVGGPCVNTVAAELMETGEDCAAGFNEGKALIKLFDQGTKTAMLVAGRVADDTRRAADVVHNFQTHSSEFKGTELEVSGTSMSDISITSMN